MVELLIVGGGKMGAALLGGLLSNGHKPESVLVIEPSASRAEEPTETYGVRVSDRIEPSQGSIIATKPDPTEIDFRPTNNDIFSSNFPEFFLFF